VVVSFFKPIKDDIYYMTIYKLNVVVVEGR
jgi:hypothetical protein